MERILTRKFEIQVMLTGLSENIPEHLHLIKHLKIQNFQIALVMNL